MIRILLIVFVYGGILIGFSYLMAKFFTKWQQHEEKKSHARSGQPSVTRFRDPRDGVRGNQ